MWLMSTICYVNVTKYIYMFLFLVKSVWKKKLYLYSDDVYEMLWYFSTF